MAWIEVNEINVSFPVFDGRSMSLKRSLVSAMRNLTGSNGKSSAPTVIHALQDLSFHLNDGDRLGLVGPNGCGKTTLLRVLAGVYEPIRGEVRICGRSATLLDLTLGMDIEASGIENVYLRGYSQGMTRQAIRCLEPEIADFAELGVRLQDPVRTYSDGMRLRLAFATALMWPHDILLLDEVIGVGDAGFLAKARTRLIDRMSQSRIVVIASHALDLIESFCDKAIYLRDGRVAAFGPAHSVISAYQRDIAAQ